MNKAIETIRNQFKGGRLIWPILGLAGLLLFNFFFAERFFHLEVRDGHLYGSLVDVLHQGSKVIILSLGMTLVLATRGVDLSVGSIMAIAGATAAVLVTQTAVPFGVILIIVTIVSLALGVWNGILVAYAGIQPIVATLILMVAGRGIAMMITDGVSITFQHRAFVYIGNGHFLGLPFTVTLVTAMCLATTILTRKTATGLFIEAVGGNETASRFSGINARMVKVLVYAYSGFCAGVAGLIATSNIKAADSTRVGELMELDAIFAVVVGGTALTGGRFNLAGSIVGALLIQILIATMYNLGVPPAIAPVPKAVVIVAVCLLQSEAFRRRAGGFWRRSRA